MTTSLVRCIFCLFSIVVIASACGGHQGFDDIGNEHYSRLDKFGDCRPNIHDAAHFIMHVRFQSLERPDLKYEFQLHHHSLHLLRIQENEDSLSTELSQAILSMNCGDAMTIRLPFQSFDRSFLSAYANETMYELSEPIELSMEVLQTFEPGEYADYLMSSSQQGELGESEAIELLLMNEPDHEYEKYGDCFIQFFARGNGDTLAVGDEVIIDYNTYLLNGKKLDESTILQFTYGMPGQIVDGLHYALSFMKMGDEAMVYMPSELAFGEAGSAGKVVPRNTPIYFRIKLMKSEI
jgi:FKBP-type peptidyl-prolyl cis-trans isomerase FklB